MCGCDCECVYALACVGVFMRGCFHVPEQYMLSTWMLQRYAFVCDSCKVAVCECYPRVCQLPLSLQVALTLLPSIVMIFMSGHKLALRSNRRLPRCLITSRALPEGPTLHFISPRPRSFQAPPSNWKRTPSEEKTLFSSSSPVTCFFSSGSVTLEVEPTVVPKLDPADRSPNE